MRLVWSERHPNISIQITLHFSHLWHTNPTIVRCDFNATQTPQCDVPHPLFLCQTCATNPKKGQMNAPRHLICCSGQIWAGKKALSQYFIRPKYGLFSPMLPRFQNATTYSIKSLSAFKNSTVIIGTTCNQTVLIECLHLLLYQHSKKKKKSSLSYKLHNPSSGVSHHLHVHAHWTKQSRDLDTFL